MNREQMLRHLEDLYGKVEEGELSLIEFSTNGGQVFLRLSDNTSSMQAPAHNHSHTVSGVPTHTHSIYTSDTTKGNTFWTKITGVTS